MITISGLTKTFGHTTVLAGVDFSIARGARRAGSTSSHGLH